MGRVLENSMQLSAEEVALLGQGREFELIPNEKGMFLLIDKAIIKEKASNPKKKEEDMDEEKQQVLVLIKKARLSDLVEGKFEATLNEKQKKALLDLVVSGRVFVFKLNETYKKGVYRVREDALEEKRGKKDSENPNAREKELSQYNFADDGFVIAKSKDRASQLSFEFEKQIKEGLMRGQRSFDGNYYLIENDLLEHYIGKVTLALSQKNNQTTEELSKSVTASKMLVKIVCEFLKEEGEILEKRGGIYQYIK